MADEINSWERQTINNILEMNIKEQRSRRRWGIFFKLFIVFYLVIVTYMIFSDKKDFSAPVSMKNSTAVVSLIGEIGPEKDASAEEIIPLLRKAFESSSKAVILRINSPGGTPVQAKQIYNEMQRLRKAHQNKKLYAVIEEAGASGAYWVACGADKIYADQTSLVGSIGVILGSFGLVDTMKKVGAERRVYASGDNKDMLDPFMPRNPRHDAMIQKEVDLVAKMFSDLVKTSRGSRLKETADMFSGRFWIGMEAKELGLIDDFGDIYTVSRDVAGAPELVYYEPKRSLFSQLGGKFSNSFKQSLLSFTLS